MVDRWFSRRRVAAPKVTIYVVCPTCGVQTVGIDAVAVHAVGQAMSFLCPACSQWRATPLPPVIEEGLCALGVTVVV